MKYKMEEINAAFGKDIEKENDPCSLLRRVCEVCEETADLYEHGTTEHLILVTICAAAARAGIIITSQRLAGKLILELIEEIGGDDDE